jgi:serine/threonine protein kinase
MVTDEDIANEAKTLSAVCTPGLCKYVVEVHRHDWLPDKMHYFIDMELCDLTLEDRIREMGLNSVPEERTLVQVNFAIDKLVGEQNSEVQLPQFEMSEAQTIQQAPTDQVLDFGSPTSPESSPDASPVDEFSWEPVMEILEDMTSGLIYIHGKNIVHRDLKPRNGINIQSEPFVDTFAVLFSGRDKCWKLADFGSAATATSKKLVTTALARGTDGYRAPEVLTRDQYNKRCGLVKERFWDISRVGLPLIEF